MARRGLLQGFIDSREIVLDPPSELWAHCPHCSKWFVVEDPGLETLLLCPDDLQRADETQVRLAE